MSLLQGKFGEGLVTLVAGVALHARTVVEVSFPRPGVVATQLTLDPK